MLILESGEGKERETLIGCLLHSVSPGIECWGTPSSRALPAAAEEHNSTKASSAWGKKAGQSLRGEGPRAPLPLGFYWV